MHRGFSRPSRHEAQDAAHFSWAGGGDLLPHVLNIVLEQAQIAEACARQVSEALYLSVPDSLYVPRCTRVKAKLKIRLVFFELGRPSRYLGALLRVTRQFFVF